MQAFDMVGGFRFIPGTANAGSFASRRGFIGHVQDETGETPGSVFLQDDTLSVHNWDTDKRYGRKTDSLPLREQIELLTIAAFR